MSGEREEGRTSQEAEIVGAVKDKKMATNKDCEPQTRWPALGLWLGLMVISIQRLEMILRIDLNSP